jgi:hypothetical protein
MNQVDRTNAATRQIEASGRSTCERTNSLTSTKNSDAAGQAFTPLAREAQVKTLSEFFVKHGRSMEAIVLEMVDYRYAFCIPDQKTWLTLGTILAIDQFN